MLIILVLAESFDSFSIGKLISIKRDFEIKKEENKILERKNFDLINQLISISNSQNQKQQNTNVYGDYYNESSKNIQREKSESDNVQELMERIGNSIVITDLESRIKDELKANNLEIDSDSSKVLLRHLVGTQLLLQFERIHSSIFGSQIFFLKTLNKNIPKGLSEIEINAYFDKVKQTYPEAYLNWSSEQYFAFLLARQLIIYNPDKSIHITNLGVEYLTWIIRSGQNEDKRY